MSACWQRTLARPCRANLSVIPATIGALMSVAVTWPSGPTSPEAVMAGSPAPEAKSKSLAPGFKPAAISKPWLILTCCSAIWSAHLPQWDAASS